MKSEGNLAVFPRMEPSTGAVLREHHERLMALCDELERFADQLPSSEHRSRGIALGRVLCTAVRDAHAFEEDILFPALSQQGETMHLKETTITRLRFEHLEDESYASEIQDALIDFAAGGPKPDSDMLAYMLRGFFEGMRRHIAFEREYIAPILERKEAVQ